MRSLSSRASREPASLESALSGLHKVDAAKAAMAGCWLFKQHTEKGEMKEVDGSSSIFKAGEVDKPLVLFTGSF